MAQREVIRAEGGQAGGRLLGDAAQHGVHESGPGGATAAGARQGPGKAHGLVNRREIRGAVGGDDLVCTQAQHVTHAGLDALGVVGHRIDEPVEETTHLDGAEGQALRLLPLARIDAGARALRDEGPIRVRAVINAAQHPERDPPGRRCLRTFLAGIPRT